MTLEPLVLRRAALVLIAAAALVGCVAQGDRTTAPVPEGHSIYYLSRPHLRFDCKECHATGWSLQGVRCYRCHRDEAVIHHRDNPPCARCHFTDYWENIYR